MARLTGLFSSFTLSLGRFVMIGTVIMGKNLQDLVEFLFQVPLFSSVPPEQINEIAALFKRETYRKDDVVCRQGEPGDSMYIIRSGIVSVFKEIDGKEVNVSDLKRGGGLISSTLFPTTYRMNRKSGFWSLNRILNLRGSWKNTD